jgi:hypothetical protein
VSDQDGPCRNCGARIWNYANGLFCSKVCLDTFREQGAPHPVTGNRAHAAMCEAEADHPHDCSLATELARLRAFAEAVRDDFSCMVKDAARDDAPDAEGCGDVDDCWHCYAVQALERAR